MNVTCSISTCSLRLWSGACRNRAGAIPITLSIVLRSSSMEAVCCATTMKKGRVTTATSGKTEKRYNFTTPGTFCGRISGSDVDRWR